LLDEGLIHLVGPFKDQEAHGCFDRATKIQDHHCFWLRCKLLPQGGNRRMKLVEWEGHMDILHRGDLLLCLSSKQAALLGHGVLLVGGGQRVGAGALWHSVDPRSLLQALGGAALVALADAIVSSGGCLPIMTHISTGGIAGRFCSWVGALHTCSPLPTMRMYLTNSTSVEKLTWMFRLLASLTSMKG